VKRGGGGLSPIDAQVGTSRPLSQLRCQLPRERGSTISPFATTARASGGVRLIALNKVAQEMGLTRGMMLAGAKALVPDIQVADSDPVGEASDLLALSRWAMRWTPYVAPAKGLTNTHALFLDITGCAHLFGGEEAMLGDMLRKMRALGLTARAACASTPGAAFALARFAPEARDGLSAPDGAALRALVGSMPIEGLRIGDNLAASLRALGLKTIGTLAGQSSAALARRFGIDLVRALDRARGHEDEAITPVCEIIPRRLRLRLMEPLMTRDGLEKAIGKAAGEISTLLEAHNEGALKVVVNLYRVDGVVLSLEGGTGRPHRDAVLWNRVLRERVEALANGEGLDLGFGIDVIEIVAPMVQVLAEVVADLDPVAAAALASSDALHRLADRMSARLGPGRVRRLGVVAGHVPERTTFLPRLTGEVAAQRSEGVFAISKATPPQSASLTAPPWDGGAKIFPPHIASRRPAMLLDHAEPIEAMAEVPDGPPRMFHWRALSFKVACAQGPERILCGEEHARDYYRVETTEGRRFWLYRQGLPGVAERPRWYVQGSGA
jgi:protein ImuB